MPQVRDNRFHPKRWTALTWLAVAIWSVEALPLNYPPSVSYRVDPKTGEWSEPTHYKSLSDIPFPVGWPLHYVEPSDPFTGPLMAGMPLPPRAPSRVSILAMVANAVLIASAISALVYLLQKYKYRYSLLFVFAVMSAYPLFIAGARLVRILAGPGSNAGSWYFIAIYFLPIPIALAVRFSWYPRINWARFRPNRNADRRALESYDNPDDAIAAASKLEMRGDWPASMGLYRHIANRWPEHAGYMQQCIDRLAEKETAARR